MKLHVLSDLHLNHAGDFTPPRPGADVVVLAGDVDNGDAGLDWARAAFPGQPIVYVPGNHEYYDQRLPDFRDTLRARAAALGIHLLENDWLVLGGVRFLGTTLWVNYGLNGPGTEHETMEHARERSHECRRIRHRAPGSEADAAGPEFLLELHREAHAFLRTALAEPFDGPTVVVTHHGPHRLSIGPKFAGDPAAACYVSHLPELVRPPVTLWVHGHVHQSMDYVVDGTRVLANPRGYAGPNGNPDFDPTLIVEV